MQCITKDYNFTRPSRVKKYKCQRCGRIELELYRCKCTSKELAEKGKFYFYCRSCTDQKCLVCKRVDHFERDTESEGKLSKHKVHCPKNECERTVEVGMLNAHIIESHDKRARFDDENQQTEEYHSEVDDTVLQALN